MLAHELVVAQHDLGFIRLDDKLARAAQFAETLRGVPVALVLLAIAVAPGVCEELFFRGFLQTALEAPARDGRPRRWTAFFTTATAFAAFHLFNPLGFTPERFLPSLLLGLALGLLRLASGSTWPGILMHVLNNGLAISADRLGLDLGPAQSALLSVVHLPAAWLAAGAGMILLGAGLVALARPRPAPAASEPAAPPPESIP
jgi:ABC-2 type transport system permease protein/sodium transport system permease protein